MKVLLLVTSFFILNSSLFAADKINPKKCSEELNQHCSSHKGKKSLGKCIQDHFKDFSKGCGNHLLGEASRNNSKSPQCAMEFQKSCENADKECYDKNRKKMSQGCQEEMDQIFSETAFKMLDSCMGDIEKKCPLDLDKADDPMAQSKYNECVLKNMKDFSQGCLDSLGMDRSQFEDDKTKTIKKEKR